MGTNKIDVMAVCRRKKVVFSGNSPMKEKALDFHLGLTPYY